LIGTSYGVTHPATGASPWFAPSLGLLALFHVTEWLSLALRLEGLVPVLRESFQVEGIGPLFRPPPVAGRALLGPELRF
jgi:hypothetical protein